MFSKEPAGAKKATETQQSDSDKLAHTESMKEFSATLKSLREHLEIQKNKVDRSFLIDNGDWLRDLETCHKQAREASTAVEQLHHYTHKVKDLEFHRKEAAKTSDSDSHKENERLLRNYDKKSRAMSDTIQKLQQVSKQATYAKVSCYSIFCKQLETFVKSIGGLFGGSVGTLSELLEVAFGMSFNHDGVKKILHGLHGDLYSECLGADYLLAGVEEKFKPNSFEKEQDKIFFDQTVQGIIKRDHWIPNASEPAAKMQAGVNPAKRAAETRQNNGRSELQDPFTSELEHQNSQASHFHNMQPSFSVAPPKVSIGEPSWNNQSLNARNNHSSAESERKSKEQFWREQQRLQDEMMSSSGQAQEFWSIPTSGGEAGRPNNSATPWWETTKPDATGRQNRQTATQVQTLPQPFEIAGSQFFGGASPLDVTLGDWQDGMIPQKPNRLLHEVEPGTRGFDSYQLPKELSQSTKEDMQMIGMLSKPPPQPSRDAPKPAPKGQPLWNEFKECKHLITHRQQQ